MASTYYGCCFKDGRPCKHGPLNTAIYVSNPDDDVERQITQCRVLVSNRRGNVVMTVAETRPDDLLAAREGWGRIMTAVAEEAVDAIVVHSPATVGLDAGGFEVLKTDFYDRAVLMSAIGRPEYGLYDPTVIEQPRAQDQ
ncbi:hypothetical protein [Streptomyces sp. I05A-00742]|uniref:hypothetical protein n=1 Tax=Streptomyces sp. I05A-00742 TaxID=2732853 RepID=UPI001489327C|nr:hypothetical protein [Streptomyces sp. I05A-00742]